MYLEHLIFTLAIGIFLYLIIKDYNGYIINPFLIVIGCVLPDLDYVLYILDYKIQCLTGFCYGIKECRAIICHGDFHSLFVGIVVVLITCYIINKLMNMKYEWKYLFLMIYIGFVLHLLEDYITYYSYSGVRWLMPIFSKSFGSIGLFEPYQAWNLLFDIHCLITGMILLYIVVGFKWYIDHKEKV